MWKYSLVFCILFFISCKDECSDKECLNGGVCIDGECDCPERWGGDDCSEQIIPTWVRVKNLTLEPFSGVDEFGEPWDAPGDGPDLTFEVTENSAPVVYTHPLFLANVDHTVQNNFVINGDLLLDPLKFYVFHFYDHDFANGNTFIGTGRIVPVGTFSNSMDIILAEDGNLAFSIAVEYEW